MHVNQLFPDDVHIWPLDIEWMAISYPSSIV